MILEFIGNAPKTKYVSIGVNGNNLVDDLVFIIGRKQGKNDLYEFTPKIKITTSERDFAEYSGDDLTVEKIEERDTIKITYALPEIVTECGNVILSKSSVPSAFGSISSNSLIRYWIYDEMFIS